MTTPITKEQLIEKLKHRISVAETYPGVEEAQFDATIFKIALAALDAEKIILYRERNPYNGMTTGWQELTDDEYEFIKDNAGENAEFRTVFTAPPALVVPAFDEWLEIRGNKPLGWVKDAMRESYDACRAAMLQGKAEPVSQPYKLPPNSFTDAELEMMSHGDNPQANAYRELLAFRRKLPELIEGMEVSIDVSTCDADAGNRYFGTVTELSELDGAKNGYILLVQDAKPNFDVNGNSPVNQDGSANMLRRWLAFGRALQSSGSQLPRHLIAETESMLAAAP